MNPLERRLVFEQLETRRMLADTIAVQIRIAASSDDAEERPSGNVTLTSSDLELTLDSPNQQTIGMRFGGVSIPQAAHIQNAYLQFQVDETGSDPTSLTFHGQAIDSAPTFTSTSGNISSRTTTAASVPWSPSPWNVRGEAGPDQRTPNLAAVIQEIVNRPGWSSGNSLAIIVTGTGARTAESFNGAASAAPLLYVEYTLGNVAPNERPVTTGIADVSVAEDDGNSVIDLFAAFSDPEDPDTSLTYSIQANTNPALFAATSIDGAMGTLTLDYAPNAGGTADITVRATDTGFPVLFVETSFTVAIAEVNDIPTRTAGALSDLTVVQNSPAASLGLTNLAYGPGGGSDENGQTLSYRVTTVPSSTLGDIVLADGTTVVTPGPYTLGQIRGMQFKPAADVFGGPETFGFTVTDNGTTAGLNDFQTLSQTIEIRVTEFVPAPVTIEVRLAAGSDDAEEQPSGSVDLNSSDLELTMDKTDRQIVGMRFNGVNLPPGASVQNAYIQFQADETGSTPTSLVIYGQASDNATTFASANGNVSNRVKTLASVPWSPAPWNVRGEAGPDQRTPNLAAVIQEIVNRPGWSSGNSLAIIVTGTGARTAESFNGAASAAPLLHVEYIPGNVAPNERPVTTGIADVSVAEDAANSVIDLFAAFSDPEDPDTSLTYSVQTNTNPALFAATSINSALGTLTLDYAPNAGGTAEITVRATDTGFPVLFVETTFTVTITEVNDIPTLTAGTLSDLTVVQNSPATSLGLTSLAYGPGGGSDENGQTLSYRVTTVSSSNLGDIVLADGTTVVTPGPYTLGQIRGMQFKAAADVFGGPETFGFTVTDDGTTAGLNDFQTLSQTIEIRVTEFVPAPVTIEVRLAAGSDDAEEQPSGSVDLNSSDLELTLDKSDQQIVGMRFNGVNLPPGASIQNAYIQFQADETGSTPTSLVINGQASDNATTFASADGNVSNRVKTLASVPWSPAPWNVRGEAGLDQRTPNLAAVIQEIVNRPGWSSGNSLAIIVTGTGARTAESFNGAASAAPLLHVEYVPGNSGPPANRTPAAVNDTATTHHATPVTTYVMLNDGLGDPPTLITSVTQGNNGTVAFDAAAGTTTYTPNNTFLGTDTYTYTITDSDGDTSAAIVTVTVTDGTAPSPIVFRVMGDVPYEDGELDDVEADLANIGAADEFFVHVGDITSGSGPWDESVYTSMASTLETSSIPVFILPGDNEWNDSPDPDRAWSYWEDHLLRLDEHWSYSFTVYRQSVREENFAFVHSGVLFIGINLVGGSVHDEDEWSQRMTDDANWVNENLNNFGSQVTSMVMFGHAFPDPTGDDRQQFGQDFVEAAQAFGKPILYMMGDEHDWTLDNPYSDAPNVTRVVVDQGVPSVRVTVTHDPANPFTFDRTP